MQWSDIPRNPTAGTLRQFAVGCLLFFGALAVWHGWHHERVAVGACLALAAIVIGVPGMVHPPLIRWVFVGWMMAVFPIGWLVSRTVLATVFYGCFTPLALLFRLIGRDALALKHQPHVSTYWLAKPIVTDVNRYFQQF